MIKEDFSHIYAKNNTLPTPFGATITLNILSETREAAQETLELLEKHFERFDDIEVVYAEVLDD